MQTCGDGSIVVVVQYIKMTKDLDLSKTNEQQRNTATIPRTVGNGNKGYIPMGNRPKRHYRSDQNG